MKWIQRFIKLSLAAMLLSAGVANASLYKFDLTGDYAASWQIDTAFAPDVYGSGEGFVYWDVNGFPDAVLGVADVYFYSAANDGGLEIYDFWAGSTLVLTDGPQLYTGTEDNPVFTTGVFALTEFEGSGNYRLTISEVLAPIAAVPEPATGALLLGGMGLMVAIRRRKYGR